VKSVLDPNFRRTEEQLTRMKGKIPMEGEPVGKFSEAEGVSGSLQESMGMRQFDHFLLPSIAIPGISSVVATLEKQQ